MGEFIDQVMEPQSKPSTSLKIAIPQEPPSPSLKSPVDPTTPPDYIPPAPPPLPKTPSSSAQIPIPSPKSPELDDEVFEMRSWSIVKTKEVRTGKVNGNNKEKLHSSDDDEATEEESESEFDSGSHNDDPGVASDSDTTEQTLKRTFSEPIPGKKKDSLKLVQPEVEVVETKPLKSRPTHKPLFNLASFGKKKKEKKPEAPTSVVPDRTLVAPSLPSPSKPTSSSGNSTPSTKKFHSPKKIPDAIEPLSPKSAVSSPSKDSKNSSTSSSFSRRDRSRSPVSKKGDLKDRWSKDQFCEVAIDVPQELRSPKKPINVVNVELHHQPSPVVKEQNQQKPVTISNLPASPKLIAGTKTQAIRSPSPPPPPLPSVSPPTLARADNKLSETSLDESEDEGLTDTITEKAVDVIKQSDKSVEIVELEIVGDATDSESDSVTLSPPYSPAIKV